MKTKIKEFFIWIIFLIPFAYLLLIAFIVTDEIILSLVSLALILGIGLVKNLEPKHSSKKLTHNKK